MGFSSPPARDLILPFVSLDSCGGEHMFQSHGRWPVCCLAIHSWWNTSIGTERGPISDFFAEPEPRILGVSDLDKYLEDTVPLLLYSPPRANSSRVVFSNGWHIAVQQSGTFLLTACVTICMLGFLPFSPRQYPMYKLRTLN